MVSICKTGDVLGLEDMIYNDRYAFSAECVSAQTEVYIIERNVILDYNLEFSKYSTKLQWNKKKLPQFCFDKNRLSSRKISFNERNKS